MYELEKDLIEKSIRVESVYLGEIVEDKQKMDNFQVTLSYQGREMTTTFKMGLGHRIVDKSKLFDLKTYGLGKYAGKKIPYGIRSRDIAILEEFSKATKPEVADVLYCLLSDALCGQDTFEDFCNSLGYTTDSRKSLEIYLSCQKTEKDLRKLLGNDFNYFMENNEY